MTPKPYYNTTNCIRAFVLGCDPTAFDRNNKPLEIEYVFDITKDKRYFAGINSNLKRIGLCKECVYVQNLVTGYQDFITAQNNNWKNIALSEISARKDEFDNFDPDRKMPVFLTSMLLYDVLLNEGENPFTAKELYELKTEIPVPAHKNKLGRPLIPLFRHYAYAMDNPERFAYLQKLKGLFATVSSEVII